MSRGSGFDIHIDPRLNDFLKSADNGRLERARKNAVEAAGMVWADTAKQITRSDGHVDTGLYINSIGYVTGSPASSGDRAYDLRVEPGRAVLDIGSNVAYAEALEKRFNIMARALDSGLPRMRKAAEEQVKRALFD